MVNKMTIAALINTLRAARNKLDTLAQTPPERFFRDFTKVESTKHLLQTSIQACIDMAHHLVADENWRTPENSYDAFVVLQEFGVLPEEFLPTLQNMVRFRNRIVHLYWEVDEAFVYDILQHNLQDFDIFASYVLDYVNQA